MRYFIIQLVMLVIVLSSVILLYYHVMISDYVIDFIVDRRMKSRKVELVKKLDNVVAMAYFLADSNGVIPGYTEDITIIQDGFVDNLMIIASPISDDIIIKVKE